MCACISTDGMAGDTGVTKMLPTPAAVGADQHDLVAVLVQRDLAALDVEEGIDLEGRLATVAILVEEGQHVRGAVGADVQVAELAPTRPDAPGCRQASG